jgi:hypothetical protein
MSLVPMAHPMPANNEREAHLRVLADKLLFKVERSGERFTLSARPTCQNRCGMSGSRSIRPRNCSAIGSCAASAAADFPWIYGGPV